MTNEFNLSEKEIQDLINHGFATVNGVPLSTLKECDHDPLCSDCYKEHLPSDHPTGCPDCEAAARHAYSDATTPGFFYDKYPTHRSK